MDNMSDLSFTQTSRAMSSKPLTRAKNQNRPWGDIVKDHNKLPKVITLRENGVKVKTITGYA